MGNADHRLKDRVLTVFEETVIGIHHLLFDPVCVIGIDLFGITGSDIRYKGAVSACGDTEDMEAFLQLGWTARRVADDGNAIRYEVGEGGPGARVDLFHEPDRPTGTWTFAEGAVHHGAFQVESFDVQNQVKDTLESLGFTDCSDVKDRGYFHSVYVRTPSGVLFETTVSKPEGFTIDEEPNRLGQEVMIAPQFESERAEILAQLEPLPD